MTESPRNSMHKFSPRRIFRGRGKTWMVPAAMLVIVLAVIAGALVMHSVSQRHLQLDDGTVWVTSQADQKAARYNVRLREPDASVTAQSPNFDIAQHGGDVILAEPQKASGIDQSTMGTADATATTSTMRTLVGGRTAAIIDADRGEVWVGKADGIAHLSPTTATATMKLGTGGRIAIAADGTVYGLDAHTAKVYTVGAGSNTAHEIVTLNEGEPIAADSFTVVDGQPVASSGNRLYFGRSHITVDGVGTLTLQAPPADTDDRSQRGWVAAAAPGALVTMPLNEGAKPAIHRTAGTGEAAQPVSVNGCVHGAWSQTARNYATVCSANGEPDMLDLQAITATANLRLRVNHRLVVLNDIANGNIWNPADSPDVIQIQWKRLDNDTSRQTSTTTDSTSSKHTFARECSTKSGQIRAVDDEFGIRAGSNTVIDPLRNDEQTDCSVLRITSVSSPENDSVKASAIYDGRFLQVSAHNPGRATFTYEIGDGRGQSSRATVTLTIAGDQNRTPTRKEQPEETEVEQGATYTMNALGGFVDPDGDPLTLVGASVENTDEATVSARPDGELVFHAGSMREGRAAVRLQVSDGRNLTEATVYFTIRPPHTLAANIDPVCRTTTPNTAVTVDLSKVVHATSADTPQLTRVDNPERTNVTMRATDMSFTFQSSEPGTYHVPYTIVQGDVEASGLARIDVEPDQEESARPVAANDVALLGADKTAIVEPLANDVDPMGGVLAVTDVRADAKSGIKAGIVGNKRVYITAQTLPSAPVSLDYTVANAQGIATGTIVVQPPALTSADSVPKASDITVPVRTGGIVSVDVLDHVSYTGASALALDRNLKTDAGKFRGLAFASSNTVRYQAPSTSGNYPLTYTVTDALGNASSAVVTFAVHDSDAESKSAPKPTDVEAQVAAGRKIRIPIRVTGIDTDGDDVQLLGLGNNAPKLGRVMETGADYLVYEAFADSVGTDTFSYAVEDWTGRRAQAQVRVGVFQSGADSGVYARDDSVTLRPGTSTTVPVLRNDIASDNSNLVLENNVQCQGIDNVKVQGGMISLTAPDHTGTAYIIYTVRNAAGVKDVGLLSVTVDPNAPIQPPSAYDYRVPASATVDKRTVNVDVSAWISNPSGSLDELAVNVDKSAAQHARATGDTTLSIDLTDEARAIAYTVTNTTHGITSTAFIHVPAYGVFPPTLRPQAPPLRVNAGETITIPLADHVRVGAGKAPMLANSESVSATKSDNDDYVVNSGTLRFTARRDYSGPASITFTVTDGSRGTNVRFVNTAVITLPITVIGNTRPAPTFAGTTVDVVAGEAATVIDLNALVSGGANEDRKPYSFTGGQSSAPFTTSLTTDGKLTVAADATATPGATQSIPITLDYGNGALHAGITVRAVPSTRPLARLNPATIRLKPGESTGIDVTQGAYNPFPQTPLSLVSANADADSTLQMQTEGTVLRLSAPPTMPAATYHVVITVMDATKTEERSVSATLTVVVQNVPGAPLLSPVAAKPEDSAVTLNWTTGSANGSPITDYLVRWQGGEQSCGNVTSCRIGNLHNGTTYTFTVRARNAIGWSPDSNAVTGRPNRAPEPPGQVQVRGGHRSVEVSWNEPDYAGSRPSSYTVQLQGPDGWTKTNTRVTALATSFEIDNNVITDSSAFSATVVANNEVGASVPSRLVSTRDVWGDPDAPQVSITQANDHEITGTVTLGNMRRAGCASIQLSHGTTSCESLRFRVPLDNAMYFKPLSVSATVHTSRRPATVATGQSNTIEPTIGIAEPSVRMEGRNDECILEWSVPRGRHDGVHVKFGSIDANREPAGSETVRLSPWERCPAGEVRTRLQGHYSPPARATSTHQYRVAPTVDANEIEVSWSQHNRDAIVMRNTGRAFTDYGQPVTITLPFSNGFTTRWNPDTDVTVRPAPGESTVPDNLRWTASITMNEDAGYAARTEEHTVQGIRRAATTRTIAWHTTPRLPAGHHSLEPHHIAKERFHDSQA